MRLVAFSVHNYRSIKSTPRLELSNLTVIVGPNNEGKSNLLSALVCALALAQEVRGGLRRTLLGTRSPYIFHRDFPMDMQGAAAPKPSRFMLEFALDAGDIAAFRRTVGSMLSGTLRIQISVNRDGEAGFTVVIQGPAQRRLSAKRSEIGTFISERLQFQYIGAMRSEEQSRDIVEAMVSRALMDLDANAEYQRALKLIEDAEKPLFDAVSRNVESSLRPFLPALRGVETRISKEQRTRALRRSVEMWLDDGTPTPLAQKGDGVKSLAAIALVKAAAETSAGGRNLILAIEEPEAHLHSGAIHSLKKLLQAVAAERQVIISTHEPALVEREILNANIIVENNKARPAKNLDDVRRVLGVQIGENLVSPDLVVLVEGSNDERLLEAVLSASSPHLREAIKGGRLVFRALGGAGNLVHQLRLYRSLVCHAVALLDDDAEGNIAFARAKEDGLADGADVFLTRRPGMTEAELEDLIDPKLYVENLCEVLGVQSLRPRFSRSQKLKWSGRIEAVLLDSGKPRADIPSLVAKSKHHVSTVAMESVASCFIPALDGPIQALISSVSKKLGLGETV